MTPVFARPFAVYYMERLEIFFKEKFSWRESTLRVLNYIAIYYGPRVCQTICSISHGKQYRLIYGPLDDTTVHGD